MVTCVVGTTQCENKTIKCKKKVREPLNVTKELLYVMLKLHNVRIEPSNMRKYVIWYSRFSISRYHTPFFEGGTEELPL